MVVIVARRSYLRSRRVCTEMPEFNSTIMRKLIPAITASACLTLSALAGTISYTFKGVTTQNDVPAGAITTEFPLGTPWTLQVEWDSAAAPLSLDPMQCQYRLTKLTVTLDGVSGKWTTSSLPNKPSMNLGKYPGNLHELQFTSGASAADHTNQTIANWKAYSANIVLSDPTGTAISSFTPVPTTVDMTDWTPNVTNTHFKLYVTNAGATEFKTIFGRIQSVSSSFGSEISVQQPKGKELKDGKTEKDFGSSPEGKKGPERTFTIRNTGTSTLSGLKLTKSGSNKKDFLVSPLSKSSLAPGAKTTFTVSFKPKDKGARKAKLEIASNDADENPFSIVLTGTGK